MYFCIFLYTSKIDKSAYNQYVSRYVSETSTIRPTCISVNLCVRFFFYKNITNTYTYKYAVKLNI